MAIYYFNQLAGTTCNNNRIPTIGYLSIDSTDSDDGFQYYVTDESNKNLALARQSFSYLNFAKGMNGDKVYCAFDDSQKMRIPINGLYVVAQSTNWIFSTYLRYSIDIGCAKQPYYSVSTQFEHSGQRVYEGTAITLHIRFLSTNNENDDWQKGLISVSGSSSFSFSFTDGEGYYMFNVPSGLGTSSYNIYYYPNNVYGASNQNIGYFAPFTVYQLASIAKLYPRSSIIQLTNSFPLTFLIDYEILDNDGTITPEVPSSSVSVSFYQTSDVEMKNEISSFTVGCNYAAQGYGIGTFTCSVKRALSGDITAVVKYNRRSGTIGSTKLRFIPNCFGKSATDKTVCSGNGVCAQQDVCTCQANFGGSECETAKCGELLANDPRVCSGHGSCLVGGNCVCTDNSKWGGSLCEIPKCNGTLSSDSNVCSAHGVCNTPEQCTCGNSWTGSLCETPMCNGIVFTDSSVCNSNGACVDADTCVCQPSWTGQFCQTPVCNGTLATDPSVCNGKGNCTSAETCQCNENEGGQYCQILKCGGLLETDPNVCSGRGKCLGENECQCGVGYVGEYCQRWECAFNQEQQDGLVSIQVPTPIITSTVTSSNEVLFLVSYAHDQTVDYQHRIFIGNSKFSLTDCTFKGDYPLSLTLKPKTRACWRDYNTTQFKLSEIISHPLAVKEQIIDAQQDEITKITIPLTLEYFDAIGESSDGICRSFEFKTTQTIYVKSTCLIGSSFVEYSPLYSYSAQLYSSQTTTVEGVLQVTFVLVATNLTLNTFDYYNTSSSQYTLQVKDASLMYQAGQKSYYLIETNSVLAQSDFRAKIFFKSNLKREGVLDTVDIYFPVLIDYEIVTPPSNQNYTLQAEMLLAADSTNWTPKSAFIGGERVFVKVSSKSFALLETNHLSVKDAYLCCFKDFVASLPSSGCTQYNSNTMDVWKQIISSTSNVNADISTTIHPFINTNYAYGFSFQIASSLFPEKLSTTASTCFVQARVGSRVVSRSQMEDSTWQASLFLVDSSKKRASSLANGLGLSLINLMFILLALVVQ